MSAYQCSCGWSVHQLPEQSDAEYQARILFHEKTHDAVRRLLAENL